VLLLLKRSSGSNPRLEKKSRGPLDWATRIEEVTPRFPSTLDMEDIKFISCF